LETFKIGEQKDVRFIVRNYGKDAAEEPQIMYHFPPEFSVLPKSTYAIVKQTLRSRYPEYNTAIFRMKLFHVDISKPFSVLVNMPDKTGKYDIPISIRARRIGRSDHKVTVQITS